MSDAPERIWACCNSDGERYWCDDDKPYLTANLTGEYVRADRIAALEAENARLRAIQSALGAYLAGEPSRPPVTGRKPVSLDHYVQQDNAALGDAKP